MILQGTEITIHVHMHFTEYRNCTIELNHNTTVILMTGLYNVLTVKILGMPSCREGLCGLKLAQAYCSLQSSFCWFFSFYTLCWIEPRIHSPQVSLDNSGRHLHSFD